MSVRQHAVPFFFREESLPTCLPMSLHVSFFNGHLFFITWEDELPYLLYVWILDIHACRRFGRRPACRRFGLRARVTSLCFFVLNGRADSSYATTQTVRIPTHRAVAHVCPPALLSNCYWLHAPMATKRRWCSSYRAEWQRLWGSGDCVHTPSRWSCKVRLQLSHFASVATTTTLTLCCPFWLYDKINVCIICDWSTCVSDFKSAAITCTLPSTSCRR